MPLPKLQELLLELISTHRQVLASTVAELDEPDWDALLGMARQHRLGPLLHWRLTRERAELPVPQPVRDKLAKSFKAATLRSLVLQRELLQVHRILDKSGIAYAALKGAYLAFHAYPHPALRPLRDLDILVPEDRVFSAYRALIEGGVRRSISRRSGELFGSLQASAAPTFHFRASQR